MRYKVENAIMDILHIILIGEIEKKIGIGDELETRIKNVIKLKEKVEEIEKKEIIFSNGILFSDGILVFKGETLSTRVRTEEVERAMKILSGLNGKKLDFDDVDVYLWQNNYPIILVCDSHVALVAPYVSEEEAVRE